MFRRIGTFFYQIGQGFVGVFRNMIMSTASMLVLVTCMILLGIFYLLVDNIDKGFNSIKGINVIEVFVDSEEIFRNDIEPELADMKSSLDYFVDYTFISADENFANYKTKYENDANWLQLLEDLNVNPLRASVQIEFMSYADRNFNIDDIYTLKNKLEGIEAVKSDDIKEKIDAYNGVSSTKSGLTTIVIWVMAIFLIGSMFVIMNTIKLGIYARRNEIVFMRYVGATKSFIRTPFIIEGIIIGLFSSAIALGIEYYVYQYILIDIVQSYSSGVGAEVVLGSFSDYVWILAAMFTAVGIIAGVFGSSFSIKKYLSA